MGTSAYMIDNASQIDPQWLTGKLRIGVTAGASAPEVLVQAVIGRLKELGARSVRALEGVEEHVTFPLPKGLDKGRDNGLDKKPGQEPDASSPPA